MDMNIFKLFFSEINLLQGDTAPLTIGVMIRLINNPDAPILFTKIYYVHSEGHTVSKCKIYELHIVQIKNIKNDNPTLAIINDFVRGQISAPL